jgi:hypothetical protein
MTTITRVNRARFEPGVDYFADDRCGCGQPLGVNAVALDVLDEHDDWVDGEFICADCAGPHYTIRVLLDGRGLIKRPVYQIAADGVVVLRVESRQLAKLWVGLLADRAAVTR